MLAKGIIPDDSSDITAVTATFAHRAIKGLVDAGIVKEVISTNHDGLHMKSGLKIGENLHEIHGNVYVERCVRCFKDFIRPYPVLVFAMRRVLVKLVARGERGFMYEICLSTKPYFRSK